MADDQSTPIIGIDLGTTNSVLALVRGGTPELIPIGSDTLLPSIVGIDERGDVMVGRPARNQWVAAPERTVRSIKRKMGSTESVELAGQQLTPQEISAFILRTIAQAASQAVGQPVSRAVITVPAYFNEVQRQATIEAGEIAGLTVERIINEPTAAALAYGYGVGITDEQRRILVFDLGGGTFDVSIIDLNYGVVDVMATGGDNLLGGDDFDEALAEMLADEFEAEHGLNLRGDHRAWARLLRAAEEAKIALSTAADTDVNLEFIAADRSERALHLVRDISRREFEELLEPFLARLGGCIDQTLTDAGLTAQEIDRVLLVGGSTRIPAVVDLVRERLAQIPHRELDPDAAVALGAAVQAGIIAGEEIDAILVDVTPLSLGIETATIGLTGQLETDLFSRLIRRNTTVPVRYSDVYTTMAPGQDSVMVKVYQGEDERASHNVLLGEFLVEELEPKPGELLAEVTIDFDLDINGILNVTVTDRATGKQVRERLKAQRQRLSPEQIAESQARLAGFTDAPNAAELPAETAALVERAERALAQPDLDDNLAEDIGSVVESLRRAAAAGDDEQVEELEEELIDLLMEVEA